MLRSTCLRAAVSQHATDVSVLPRLPVWLLQVLVLEYLSGGEMLKQLQRMKRYSEAKACQMFKQVWSASQPASQPTCAEILPSSSCVASPQKDRIAWEHEPGLSRGLIAKCVQLDSRAVAAR